MIEFIHTIWISGGDEAVIFSNWVLVMATTLDAKVGIRIYTRATILINLLSGKIVKHQPTTRTETNPLIPVHAAKAQNTARDRYIRA